MANELQKVGLVFTEEGAVDFKKTLQDISLELNKNYNQFKRTQAQWDSSTSSTEKLRTEQEYLTNAYQIQQDRVNTLRMQLEELENSENKNTTAINKKRNELTKAEIKLQDYNSRLKKVDAQLNDSNQKLQQYGKKISDVSEKISDVGNKASVISAGVVAGGTALVNSAMNLENAVAKYVSTTNTAENETEKYKQVLENINKNNYGEGYEDIADSMAQVTMQLKDLNEQDLQNITEKAIAVRDLFGYDVSESVRAVKAMMDNLNVSADEAFNLIAEGKKQGLDFSNELLDNINEYSVQFGKLGLSAEDMFNIFKVGADNGAFNLDKIGDAVKEFSIRVIDGSNTTVDGFKRIGLNADTMAKKFANGGEEAKQAFIEVVNRLGSMDDKVSQSIAGVDLFGTMWEDLGPTVITSFSKMDNGISKSSDSMQKSIDQLYNTTKKKAEAQLKRLQSLGADFGEEMLPVLEDLIDMAEGFVDKLNDMSDAEKENIVKIGLFVAALGPVIKTAGTVGKTIGSVTNGIGVFSQALGVAEGTATSTSTTVNGLAKIIGGITSPAGLAVTAVTVLAGGIAYLATRQTEAQQKAQEFAEEMQNEKEAFEEYNESIDKVTSSNLAQINSAERLKNELSTLVDENGKVKEGYEGRVSFILNQLNEALDTEYSLNKDIIQSYKDLQAEIDKTIEKKRAEVILNGEQEKWTNAVNEEEQAVQNLTTARENLLEVQDEYGLTLEELRDKAENASGKEKEYLNNVLNAYDDATQALKQNTDIQKQYANDYALFMEGKYNEVGQTIINTTSSWTDASLETIRNSITEQAKALENYKAIYEETGSEVAKTQMEQAEQNLENLGNELASRTSTIYSASQGEVLAWQEMAQESYDVYSKIVSQMPEEMKNKIEQMTGIVANETGFPNSVGNLGYRSKGYFQTLFDLTGVTEGELATATKEVNNNTAFGLAMQNKAEEGTKKFETYINLQNGRSATTDYMQGAENGINQKKRSFWDLLFGIGRQGNQSMRKGLGDGSPSVLAEEALVDYFLGADNGIEKQGDKTIKNIQEYARKMNTEFGENLETAQINPLQMQKTNINRSSINSAENSLIDYDKMANAITKALTNCKFTLDEDGFAKIVKDELYKVV